MVGNGYADVKKIEGNTIVWNQLLPPITNPASSAAGLTITQNGDGSYSISGTSTNSSLEAFDISRNFGTITQGHVYFCRMNFIKASGADPSSLTFEWTTTMNRQLFFYSDAFIVTSNQSGAGADIMCSIQPNISVNFTAKPILIDLTKMFGETVANSMTVEEFERLFPMEYAPYCEGRLVSLGGYKIKWNQMVDYDSSHYSGWNGASVSKETQGEEVAFTTINTSSDNTSMVVFSQQISGILDPSHLWYVSGFMKSSITGTVRLQLGNTNVVEQQNATPDVWYELKALTRNFSAPSEAHKSLIIRFNGDTSNVGVVYSLRKPQLFDLTAMFGPGSEPTLEEFESMFGTEYGPYDEGTEMNILEKMDLQDDLSVKSTGFNLWDEEWELGTIDSSTGQNVASSNSIRPKNLIPVFPNTVYYNKRADATQGHFFYDANGNYLVRQSVGQYTFTTPQSAAYMRFVLSPSYGTTYNHDICINLSDPAKNGTYLPYTISTQDLSWIYDLEYKPEGSTTSEKLFPYGLLSAETVHDEITDTGAVKRVGVVDLGNLTWFNSNSIFISSSLNSLMKMPVSNNAPSANGVCSKYGKVETYNESIGNDKAIYTTWIGAPAGLSLRVNDSTYTDTATFKAAMQGVMLYYELATPITITFPSPKDLGYNVQSGGTEELLPTNPSDSGPITAPVLLSVNYPLDAVGTLTNLPRNYISVTSMDSFTTALGNFLNANITRTWDATNEKYTFTVVSRT